MTDQNQASQSDRPKPPSGICVLVLLTTIFVGAVLAVVLVAIRPGARNVADLVLEIPADAEKTAAVLTTDDPGRASEWLAKQLGIGVPRIDLTTEGAKTVGAQAFPAARHGILHFENGQGTVISFHVLFGAPAGIRSLRSKQYQDIDYHYGTTKHPPQTIILWQHGGNTYVASSMLAVDDLLPFAHAMDVATQGR